jgi:preprotein translocase subunit Sss1
MVARKKIVEDQELKKLVLKLKKQKKPTWKELKSQGN